MSFIIMELPNDIINLIQNEFNILCDMSYIISLFFEQINENLMDTIGRYNVISKIIFLISENL